MRNAGSHGIWNRMFVSLFVLNMSSHLCIYMMNTLSSLYADYLGAGAAVAGLVSGLFAATALAFKLVSAPALDTFNRKHVLIFAFSILFLSYVGYFFSRNIPMLILSRLLTGTGMAFTTTGCVTMASDALPKKSLQTGLGYFTLGTALCQAIAPTLGLKFSEAFGYQATFLMLALIMVFTIALACTMKVEHQQKGTFRISVHSMIAKEALLPALLLFLCCIPYAVISSFLVLCANARGIGTDIGYFFTIYALSMLFTRPFIGRMADRYGTVKIVVPSMIAFAVSLLIISFADSLPVFYLAAVVSAFGFGGMQPTLIAVCIRKVPGTRRGAASSTGYAATDLSNLLGPFLAGYMIDSLGYAAMWRLMLVPVLISVAIAITLAGRLKD